VIPFDPKVLEGKQPSELDQRRREIIVTLEAFPKKWDDPDIPIPLLEELAFITGTLRRKTSGPPKVAKTPRRGSTGPRAPGSVSDLEEFM